jgi:hypothetical protein
VRIVVPLACRVLLSESMERIRIGLRPPSEALALLQINTSLPAKRLMLAVLDDAVNIFQHQCTAVRPRGRRLFAETERWITSDDTSWPFAFVSVCHALGLDVDCLRTGLRQWRARQLGLLTAQTAPTAAEMPHRRAS